MLEVAFVKRQSGNRRVGEAYAVKRSGARNIPKDTA